MLTSKLSDSQELDSIIRFIHVPSVARGMRLTVAMDGDNESALAFLER